MTDITDNGQEWKRETGRPGPGDRPKPAPIVSATPEELARSFIIEADDNDVPLKMHVSNKFINKIGDRVKMDGFYGRPLSVVITDIQPGQDEDTVTWSVEVVDG